jgi:predicted RNase H-like HicB family nuclease
MKNPSQAKCEIFKEDDRRFALCPELDVSSFGETIQEAKASLEEALLAFLEECENMNTLELVLEEAEFKQQNNQWKLRQPLLSELVAIG